MERFKIIAGGGLVLNPGGELLMIFRRGKWDLPKGKLDEGEDIKDCARREVMEETGLAEVETGELIGITTHDYYDTHLERDATKETHWFAMRAPAGQTLHPQTEEDITEIRWVSGAELKQCLTNTFDTVAGIITKAGLLKDKIV